MVKPTDLHVKTRVLSATGACGCCFAVATGTVEQLEAWRRMHLDPYPVKVVVLIDTGVSRSVQTLDLNPLPHVVEVP